MKIEDKLMNDSRFYIDNFTFENHLKISKMLSYRIETMRLGDILRYQNKKVYEIYKSDPYLYLENKDEKKYNEYCNNICVGEDNKKHNISIFKNLIQDFNKTNYDLKKGAIIVNQLNIIMDGQHRTCILMKKYGLNYKIPVVKIRYRYLGLFTYINYLKYKLRKGR